MRRLIQTSLVFLVEWSLYLILETLTGKIQWSQHAASALLPLGFFGLIGLLLSLANFWRRRDLSAGFLGAAAAGLLLLDQAAKTWINRQMAYPSDIPLFGGLITLSHARNYAGSWALQRLNLTNEITPLRIFVEAMLMVLVVAWFVYYLRGERGGYWTDMAAIFFTAGVSSAVLDKLLRGFTLDFIGLPGLFVADLKDIYLFIGVAALLAELVSQPQTPLKISWPETRQSIARFLRYLGGGRGPDQPE